jgi:DNA repair ATPase RecN
LVRQIVAQYLNGGISAGGGSPGDPSPDEVDPLTELDLQSLIQRINSYEKYIEKFAKDKAGWIEWVNQGKDDFNRKSRQEKFDKWYKKEYNDLYDVWYNLRDKFERLRRKIPKARAREISKKLAELKKKIDNL